MNLINRSIDTYRMAFQATDITSVSMRNAINDWFQLYYLTEPAKDEDPCRRIPYTIVRKLTKTVFSEYNATSKDEFTSQALEALKTKSLQAVQQALIGGMALIKPVPEGSGFRFAVIPRSEILVFGRDPDGRILDIGTAETTVRDKFYYTLLERRTVDDGGYLTIQNTLYRSYSDSSLGHPVPLSSLPQYGALQETYTFPNPVGSVGLVPVRTPITNCVDGSADAVSVYAAAVELIHNINRNSAQLNREFENGKLRLVVSADMLGKDKHGRRVFQDDIFVGLDEDPESTGVTAFAPPLRVDAYQARTQEYLRDIENVIGLKRGLLSEVEASERTATEITSTQGEYNLTIVDFQRMWERAVRETLQLCGALGEMYRVPGAHEITEDQVTINWGNGILFDEEKTRQQMLSEVQAGLLQPERYLGFAYKLQCDTPAQRARIRKDYMPEVAGEPEEDI